MKRAFIPPLVFLLCSIQSAVSVTVDTALPLPVGSRDYTLPQAQERFSVSLPTELPYAQVIGIAGIHFGRGSAQTSVSAITTNYVIAGSGSLFETNIYETTSTELQRAAASRLTVPLLAGFSFSAPILNRISLEAQLAGGAALEYAFLKTGGVIADWNPMFSLGAGIRRNARSGWNWALGVRYERIFRTIRPLNRSLYEDAAFISPYFSIEYTWQ